MAQKKSIPTMRIGGLKFYPQDEPADQEIQIEIEKLWDSGRAFIILSGPPGIGKTRGAEDHVLELLKLYDARHDKYACRVTSLFPDFKAKVYSTEEIQSTLKANEINLVWDICVLHPQYTYEDLIRGYSMTTSSAGMPKLDVREGVLGFTSRVVEIMESSLPKSDNPRGVLIIDEINRAPIGQLFGEALYALDRRGQPISTPYSLDGVGNTLLIPNSLFIIGTMNSVDRAVSGFDFALRRRFVTLTMVPNSKSIEQRFSEAKTVGNIAKRLYDTMKKLILGANQTATIPLSELIVGHSYFLPPSNINDDDSLIKWISESYLYQILPTIVDYQEQGLVEFQETNLLGLPGSDVLFGKRSLGEISSDEIITFLNELKESA